MSPEIFTKGETVYHAIFGEGTVMAFIAAETSDNEDDRVQVIFVEEGAKWLVTRYANLRRKPFSVDEDYDQSDEEYEEEQWSKTGELAVDSYDAPAISWDEQPEVSFPKPDQPTSSRRGILKLFAGLLAGAPLVGQAGVPSAGQRLLPVLETRIAGFAHYEGMHCIEHINSGDQILLRREPGNPHDSRAIEIYWKGHKLGYVPRSHNRALSKLMDGHEQLSVSVTKVLDRAWEPVELSVYLVV